jgi:hypothetical protein
METQVGMTEAEKHKGMKSDNYIWDARASSTLNTSQMGKTGESFRMYVAVI